MPKATLPGGPLIAIADCYVKIPGAGKVVIKALPDISDSKSAQYNDESIIGRSSPVKTFSHSASRTISMGFHFYVTHPDDIEDNLSYLRALESAVYPQEGDPFKPPPVCQLKCGSLLSDEDPLCVILTQYSVKFPTDVAWDESTFTPWRFDVDTTWEVVYKSADLPNQDRIFFTGR